MARRYRLRHFQQALNIDELRAIARRRLPYFAYEFLEGGADDEVSLRRNREAFSDVTFLPNTLVDTSNRTIGVSLLGSDIVAPLVVAPTGFNGVYRRNADLAIARAARDAGIPFTLSTLSNVALEEVADQVGGRLWLQLYVFNNPQITSDIVDRAKAAGYEALVFTTDANVFGNREWDKRNFVAPGQLSLRNRLDLLSHPRWLLDVVWPNGIPGFPNIARYLPKAAARGTNATTLIPSLFAPTIQWDDVARLRQEWPGKLLIKGVLSVADAQKAAELGCDGVVLTNHGGRQLDSCVAPFQVLPEIAEAVGGRLAIVVDSGFRRGTEVVKALALGADAVMLGRAVLYGLAAGGQPGVRHALNILATEIDRVIGHLGCVSCTELTPRLLRSAQSPIIPPA